MTDEKFNKLILELNKYDKWIVTLFDGLSVPRQTDEDLTSGIEKILLKHFNEKENLNALNEQLTKHIKTTKAFSNLTNWSDKNLIKLAIKNIENPKTLDELK